MFQEFLSDQDIEQIHQTSIKLLANVGVRFPLTQTEGRNPRVEFLLLWDWFDGGLFEGWR